MKLILIADLHIRTLSRHKEYKEYFEEFFSQLKQINPNGICIIGDIIHSRSDVSSELFDLLVWFFNKCASIAETYIILGNHDKNLFGDRLDAISPVVNAINNPKVHLYKESGVYEFAPNYFFCVYSVLDKDNWKNVVPVKGATNICLMHTGVMGAKNDAGFVLPGETDPDFFKPYDIVMLGDYHLRQHLSYKEVEIEIDENELENYPEAIVIGK